MENNNNSSHYEETFYIIPRYIRKLPGMTLSYLDVYETIFQFWNKNRTCFLSEEALCNRTGYKRTQIYDALNFFEKHGELKRIKKNGKRYLVKPEKIIETNCSDNIPMSEIADVYDPVDNLDIHVRNSGHATSGIADHNIKKLNKEKQKEKIYKKEKDFSSSGQIILHDITPNESQNKKELTPVVYRETFYESPNTNNQITSYNNTGIKLSEEEQMTFEYFWSIYPVKKNKLRARAMWFAQKCYLKAEQILYKIKEQIEKDDHFRDGFVPSPDKYIGGERWNDEIYQKKKSHFNHESKEWTSSDNIFHNI